MIVELTNEEAKVMRKALLFARTVSENIQTKPSPTLTAREKDAAGKVIPVINAIMCKMNGGDPQQN